MRGVTKLMLMILICILNLHLQWRIGLNQHEDLSSQMPGNNYHRNDQEIIKFNNKGKWFFKNKLSQHRVINYNSIFLISGRNLSQWVTKVSWDLQEGKNHVSFYQINGNPYLSMFSRYRVIVSLKSLHFFTSNVSNSFFIILDIFSKFSCEILRGILHCPEDLSVPGPCPAVSRSLQFPASTASHAQSSRQAQPWLCAPSS